MTRVAIHSRRGSFSDRWLERCDELGVAHVVVDCYAADDITRLRATTALLWNWTHVSPTDVLIARTVLAAAEQMGIAVFPGNSTCWHFDDKLAQKYLLEAIQAPLADAKAFFTLEEALAWAATAVFPIVMKLRRGAGANNVQLIHSRRQATALARQAFSKGFPAFPSYLSDAQFKLRNARARGELWEKMRRLPKTVRNLQFLREAFPREKGYLYVQEFLSENDFDTRITVIGDRAFGFTRNVRVNDFRASGSGSIDYDLKRIDPRCVQIGFEVTRRLGAQSLAFDFAFDRDRKPRILEVSYAYMAKAVYDCSGHWDSRIEWHEGHLWPQDAILADLLDGLSSKGAH